MVSVIVHRKEAGEWLKIAKAVIYLKDKGLWRLAERFEVDAYETPTPTEDRPDLGILNFVIAISAEIPTPEVGTDGDLYALLYSLDWAGDSGQSESA